MTLSNDKAKRDFLFVPITIGFIFFALFLPTLLFPGQPASRDIIHKTIAGKFATLIMVIAGGVPPESLEISPLAELKLLVFNPGIYAGLLIGRFDQHVLHSLIPAGVGLALCLALMIIPAGFWITASLAPGILVSTPYLALGSSLGSRFFSASAEK